MNERLKELAIQAGVTYDWDPGSAGPEVCFDRQEDFEKFAELIVRECANITLDYKNHDHYTGWLDHGEEIARHFGVER